MTEILENMLIFLNRQDYVDIFIYIFIFYLIIFGWRKGSSLIIFYIFSFLISIFFSFKYSFSIGVYISGWLNSNQQISQIFSGIIIFIASITAASLIQNVTITKKNDGEFGSKILGSLLSLVLSNLILTLIISLVTLFTLPNFVQQKIENSSLVSFYIEPDSIPQQSLELITGTDLLKVTNRIKKLTGNSSVVVDEYGCLEIPEEPLSKLISKDKEALEMLELINLERINENVDPVQFNQQYSDVAKDYALKMYLEGFWCHQDPNNGYYATDRLKEVGFRGKNIQEVSENLAISSTIYSGHEELMNSESHRKTILDNEFNRVGIGIMSGPTGLIIVQIFSR
tara:strand:- start:462 stop:1484 length:1023 start_codon:yes stop_codon:yes gene_type:complete